MQTILYVCSKLFFASNVFQRFSIDIVLFAIVFFECHGEVEVGDDAAASGEAVIDRIVYDVTEHRDARRELTVGQMDGGELVAGLGMVGTHGLTAEEQAAFVALDATGQIG